MNLDAYVYLWNQKVSLSIFSYVKLHNRNEQYMRKWNEMKYSKRKLFINIKSESLFLLLFFIFQHWEKHLNERKNYVPKKIRRRRSSCEYSFYAECRHQTININKFHWNYRGLCIRVECWLALWTDEWVLSILKTFLCVNINFETLKYTETLSWMNQNVTLIVSYCNPMYQQHFNVFVPDTTTFYTVYST